MYSRLTTPLSPSTVSSVPTGNSRICLPHHFYNRDFSEDHSLRTCNAPELIRQKRLEHAGLCHSYSGVSTEHPFLFLSPVSNTQHVSLLADT